MKKIMLVCNAGMSTSLMVNNMKKAAADQNLDVEIFAVPESEAQQMVDQVSVVMLGPQVSFLLNDFKEIAGKYDVAVEVISAPDYGRMNGEKVLERALEIAK